MARRGGERIWRNSRRPLRVRHRGQERSARREQRAPAEPSASSRRGCQTVHIIKIRRRRSHRRSCRRRVPSWPTRSGRQRVGGSRGEPRCSPCAASRVDDAQALRSIPLTLARVRNGARFLKGPSMLARRFSRLGRSQGFAQARPARDRFGRSGAAAEPGVLRRGIFELHTAIEHGIPIVAVVIESKALWARRGSYAAPHVLESRTTSRPPKLLENGIDLKLAAGKFRRRSPTSSRSPNPWVRRTAWARCWTSSRHPSAARCAREVVR